MKDFRTLNVWTKAHRLTIDVYTATAKYPKQEQYALTSQTRRAASSIGANIAEGCGRSGDAELTRFLFIAMGSASELEYHLMLAHDLHFLDDQLLASVIEVKRMLAALIDKTRVR